jgi:hypothetical protein
VDLNKELFAVKTEKVEFFVFVFAFVVPLFM